MTINSPMDKYIALQGANDAGGTLSWTGTSVQTVASPTAYGVRDVNEDGNLDIGQDYWLTSSSDGLFTGYIINVGGNDYGVFYWNGGYYVPFDSTVDDITATFPDPGSTSTNTDNAVVANCFLTGTLIATPGGDRAIETLRTGDLVRTADGRSVPVRWLARQTVANAPWLSPRMEPVRISSGALGNGLPHSDLTVSADHGMILDNLVINASALVNGTTIRFVPLAEMPPEFTYWHIETEAHDIILANGAPSETFLDAAGREAFDNHAEYLALYGTERIIPELRLPRIAAQRLLPEAIKARLGIADALLLFSDLSMTA